MPKPAKGLYAPKVVDLIFAVMALGSATSLAFASMRDRAPVLDAEAQALVGPVMLACVLAGGVAVCLYHRIDRKGWDDYMAQVVWQSSMIGMITFLLAGVGGELIALKLLGGPVRLPMILGPVPMAALGWAMGYFFLRWRGTGE